MSSLKDRQRQIPNGFKFHIPEVGYVSAPFSSFDTIVNSVENVIRSNPAKAQQYGWPTARADIASWIDTYNANYCLMNGWKDYVTGEDLTPPKHGPPPRLSALAAGAKSLTEWIGEGANPETQPVAEERALVCSKCPLNLPGDMSNFFERGTSEMLREAIAAANHSKMTTVHDKKLGVCSACLCPMRLKVWVPLKHILNHMSSETKAALNPNCWITKANNQEEAS